METNVPTIDDSRIPNQQQQQTEKEELKKSNPGGTFNCAYCCLEEHYDYRGLKPPFSRQIKFSEECYVMKDPTSIPNKGAFLVVGGNCNVCDKSVCLGCSVFYTKRFCPKCANNCIDNLPSQLHAKIKSLMKDEETS